MRFCKPGKIRDGLYLLGTKESCSYLLEGNRESMIINGGLNYSVSDLLDQFRQFGIDESKIKKILVLHAHFDHVGIIPYFRQRYPGIEILASPRGWEILSMPKAIKTINEFSRLMAERFGRMNVYNHYDLDWDNGFQGLAVSEGDRLDLGQMAVEIYETPGHSSCSLSAYVPSVRALFPSDGGGVPFEDTAIISGNSNYTRFQESVEKLKGFATDYICADHYGYIAGDEAKRFFENTAQKAVEYRAYLEGVYFKTRDIDTATMEVTRDFLKENPEYMIPPKILQGICG
ncbi:MBL fold metallo-hydrolase, partial [Thermodesulfobacteriota bacterium]